MSAIYNSVFGANSNSPPPILDKRNLSDTSITENSPIQTKQAKIEGSHCLRLVLRAKQRI